MKSFILNCLAFCWVGHNKNEKEVYNNYIMSLNNNIVDLLQNVEYSDTVPFVPPIQFGKVIKVYDGDTITIASVLPNTVEPIYRFSIRLNGIDTPEIKGKTQEERELAVHVRDELYKKIYGKIVYLKNVDNEKYGRILADVYLDDENINEWLISNEYAVRYDGGTKHRPLSWGIV